MRKLPGRFFVAGVNHFGMVTRAIMIKMTQLSSPGGWMNCCQLLPSLIDTWVLVVVPD